MTRTISMQTPKTQIMWIFRELEESGEELILTDQGLPALRVTRFDDQPTSAPPPGAEAPQLDKKPAR